MNALKIIYQYKEGKDCTFNPKINQGYSFSPSYQNKTVCPFQQQPILERKKEIIENNNSSYIYNSIKKEPYNMNDIKTYDGKEKIKKT